MFSISNTVTEIERRLLESNYKYKIQMSMLHSNCAVQTDPFHEISDLISV